MYYYYDHGPLARVEIGENALQGIDYYYTLQGWLKGVNSAVLNQSNDPGSDSNQDSVNANFAKDVVGFGLSYYTGDYASISGETPTSAVNPNSYPAQNSADLYNGNIRYMQTALTNPTTRDSMPMLSAYNYDQLNRLVESRSFEDGLTGNSWNPTSYNGKYHNAFTYDAMGNILTQQRGKRNGTQIEDLTYRYDYNSSGDLISNRLYHVNDNIAANVDSTDIDDMGTFDSNNIKTNNNYRYNASGQLVQDKQEEIDTIIWTATGKVKKILRTPQSSKKNLTFDYGPMGNRIAKHVYNNQTGMLESSTYYLLDAQGNQLSMYKHVVDTATATASYYLTERNIYGSSRLGMVKDTVNMQKPSILPSYGVLGNRKYALTNHLNNALTVISDVVYPISSDNTTIDGYQVGINNTYDYSPFGVALDGRTMEQNMEQCSQVATTQTVTVLDEHFETNSDWTEITNDSQISYPSGNMRVKNTNTSNPRKIGTKHSFSGGEGDYTVNFDVEDVPMSICQIIINPPFPLNQANNTEGYNTESSRGEPPYIVCIIKDSNGNEVVKDSTNVTGAFPTIHFTSTEPGNYTIEILIRQACNNAYFEVDNVVITAEKEVANMVCDSKGNSYRYGFNGMERDDAVKGRGNSYTTQFRQYDPRVGRWLTIDPLAGKFPWQSPYVGFDDNPIVFSDPLGLFSSRKLARKYKKSHNIQGRIKKEDDGLFHINENNSDLSYFKDNSLDNISHVIGRGADGVIVSGGISADKPEDIPNQEVAEATSGFWQFLYEWEAALRGSGGGSVSGGTNYYDENGNNDQAIKGGAYTDRQPLYPLPGSIAGGSFKAEVIAKEMTKYKIFLIATKQIHRLAEFLATEQDVIEQMKKAAKRLNSEGGTGNGNSKTGDGGSGSGLTVIDDSIRVIVEGNGVYREQADSAKQWDFPNKMNSRKLKNDTK